MEPEKSVKTEEETPKELTKETLDKIGEVSAGISRGFPVKDPFTDYY
ncbi:MAG: hypothetical protein LBM59_00055 [Ruminococcus sp.]|jgi:hypothetical protein|nr:hypothetical protein [Ruminococcus sp.]